MRISLCSFLQPLVTYCAVQNASLNNRMIKTFTIWNIRHFQQVKGVQLLSVYVDFLFRVIRSRVGQLLSSRGKMFCLSCNIILTIMHELRKLHIIWTTSRC